MVWSFALRPDTFGDVWSQLRNKLRNCLPRGGAANVYKNYIICTGYLVHTVCTVLLLLLDYYCKWHTRTRPRGCDGGFYR